MVFIEKQFYMEQIEYSRTVVPSSMRSPYWKYFGFPSDSSNNILTRQKVVCTICNTTIAYNKNTSNLRTHLMSKHVEIFKKIVSPSVASMVQNYNALDENIEEKSDNVKIGEWGKNQNFKRRCVEILNSDVKVQNESNSSANYTNLPEYKYVECKSNTTRENISTFAANQINFETLSTDLIAYLPSNVTEIQEVPSQEAPKNDDNVAYGVSEKAFIFSNVDLQEDHEQQLHSMDLMLADYVQTDLLPIETLEEHGFCKYNQQLTGVKIDGDTIIRVKRIIETRFTNVKQLVACHVSCLSQTKPYSLSFEIYNDIEENDVLNIYFNYLNDIKEDFISILYTSCTICTKYVNIAELLDDINLDNCSGVVVTSLEKELQFVLDFAKTHELPLIECLESLLTRCLQRIFKQTDFYADYKEFFKTILNNENLILPVKYNLRTTFKWNPLNCLEYIFSNVKQEKIDKWDELKEIFYYLKPLKDVLDVIMEERLPYCSLHRPLIKKLFEEHFTTINQNDARKYQIQKIIKKELYERILAKPFLKEVTFFDIRFHREFALNESFSDMTCLKTEVLKRFKNILQVTYLDKGNYANMEQHSTDSFVNIRKCSNLKSFLKRDVSLTKTKVAFNLKSNLDLEFEQYYNEMCLDLDESPILWWEQQSDNYKQLSKIAKFYLTIPCCCMPRLCRINMEQKYLKLDRRRNLSQFCNIESKLWFLYYNQDAEEFF